VSQLLCALVPLFRENLLTECDQIRYFDRDYCHMFFQLQCCYGCIDGRQVAILHLPALVFGLGCTGWHFLYALFPGRVTTTRNGWIASFLNDTSHSHTHTPRFCDQLGLPRGSFDLFGHSHNLMHVRISHTVMFAYPYSPL
jgi:hypothetical protein